MLHVSVGRGLRRYETRTAMAIGANRRTGHTDAGSAQTARSTHQTAQADTVAARTASSLRYKQAKGGLKLRLGYALESVVSDGFSRCI